MRAYVQQDGHTGLSNQPVGEEADRGGIRFRLSYLKTTPDAASFIIHADPHFHSLSTELQPEGVLQRLGFRFFHSCPVLGGDCHYLCIADARLSERREARPLANQHVYQSYARFLDNFPELVKTMMDVDFKLRMSGFDVFPWDGTGMKSWQLGEEPKEIFVPPAHHHEAYVAVRDILSKATRELLIVDSYVDTTIFQLLSNISASVSVRVLTRQVPADFALELANFRKDGYSIEARSDDPASLHDRFAFVDAECYHVGASLKDAGAKGFAISLMESPVIIQAIRSAVETAWTAARPL
jgi:hypothetical protein